MKIRKLITISENGIVNIPSSVCMSVYDIAHLFGVMYPTVKGRIKTLLKSGRFENFGGGEVTRNGEIIPDYFGLDMVVAIAFSLDSYEADIFRRYILSLVSKTTSQNLHISLSNQSRYSLYN